MSSRNTMPDLQAKLKVWDLLSSLRPGERVIVSQFNWCRELEMTVRGWPRRCDEPFGSWESLGVTVWLGPGRYSTRIDVDSVAHGWAALRKAPG